MPTVASSLEAIVNIVTQHTYVMGTKSNRSVKEAENSNDVERYTHGQNLLRNHSPGNVYGVLHDVQENAAAERAARSTTRH